MSNEEFGQKLSNIAGQIHKKLAGEGSLAWKGSEDTEISAKQRATSYVEEAIRMTSDTSKDKPWYKEFKDNQEKIRKEKYGN